MLDASLVIGLAVEVSPIDKGKRRVVLGERLAEDPAPHFSSHVFVCTNRRFEGHPKGSCASRGSEDLLDYIKRKAKAMGISGIRINSAGCLDRCEFGPVIVIYPEGIWYQVRNNFDADEILRQHLLNAGRVRPLMLPP